MADTHDSSEVTRRSYLKAAGAAGTVGVAGLAGCTQPGGGGNGGQTEDQNQDQNGTEGSGAPLEVLHGWTGGDGQKAVNALTDAFGNEYSDMETNFKPIGGGGNENLDAVVAKRLGNQNPPSSFANWPGKNLVKYEGVLGDVSSVWESGLRDAHVEEAVTACEHNGAMQAVPIGSHRLNCLFYNVSVVEEAGVDPSSLDSPQALIDAMDTVGQNTDAVPMAHAMKGAWTTLQLWAAVMLGQEGFDPYMSYVEGNGDEAAVKAAFQTTEEILTNYINQDASSIGFTTANQKIMNGEAAFIHQGNWVAGAYKSNDLAYDEDWGFVPFPGTEGMYTLHMDAFLYPSNNPSPEKAKTWMEFVGGKTAQVAFNQWKGSIPTRTDISTEEFGPYLTETIEDFQNADQKPPTIAHGLAVEPETQTALEDVITGEFSGPYNIDAATQGMLETVQQ